MVQLRVFTDASVHKYHKDTKRENQWGLAALVFVGSNLSTEGLKYQQGTVQIKRCIDTNLCSNPTAELLAATLAMERLYDVLSDSPHRYDIEIELYSDYIGVAMYVGGDWRVKRADSEFRKMALRMVEAAKKLKNAVKSLDVRHIKGHSGHRENEVVDSLANLAACTLKDGQSDMNIDEFPQIIKQLDTIM